MNRVLRTLVLAPTVAAAIAVAVSAPAEAVVNLGGVQAGEYGASYSCSSQTVDVLPYTMAPAGSSQTVWAYATAYVNGRWVSTGWTVADTITTLRFYGVTSAPGPWLRMTFARYYSGAWHYASEWTQIGNDVDNGFCGIH